MSDDRMGSDFSGIRAHATLEIHMKECTERQAELRSGLQAIHARLDAMQAAFDDRMNRHSNRMWATAIGVIVMLMATIAYLLPHYLGKVH